APSSEMLEAGSTPSVRHTGGIESKTAPWPVTVIVTSSTGALPGAAASSLRLNHQDADTASPVATVVGVPTDQAPSSSYTVAACASPDAAVTSATIPARTRRARGARRGVRRA